MSSFPKTTIGDLEVPRLTIGTNWFLGYSHTTRAEKVLADRVRFFGR